MKLLSYLIKDELVLFLNLNFIKGVKFDTRGKVGVLGYSRKNYKIEYQQGIVYTDTGVLGATLIYVFKKVLLLPPPFKNYLSSVF